MSLTAQQMVYRCKSRKKALLVLSSQVSVYCTYIIFLLSFEIEIWCILYFSWHKNRMTWSCVLLDFTLNWLYKDQVAIKLLELFVLWKWSTVIYATAGSCFGSSTVKAWCMNLNLNPKMMLLFLSNYTSTLQYVGLLHCIICEDNENSPSKAADLN